MSVLSSAWFLLTLITFVSVGLFMVSYGRPLISLKGGTGKRSRALALIVLAASLASLICALAVLILRQ